METTSIEAYYLPPFNSMCTWAYIMSICIPFHLQPFEVYWSKEKVQDGLKRGTLAQGALTISYFNFGLAFVSNPVRAHCVAIS
jgi:hypothetical protein